MLVMEVEFDNHSNTDQGVWGSTFMNNSDIKISLPFTSVRRTTCFIVHYLKIELVLKVPECEIFHLFDFNDFYGIKSV